MQTTFHPLFRSGCAIAAFTLTLGSVSLLAKETDAFPTFDDSYIKITGQAASISGDQAAYQARTGKKTGGAGIEDLHIVKDLAEGTALTLDGRALTQSEDYLLGVKITKDELGSIDFGYKSFRTFYDGVGGFFPVTGAFQTLAPQDLNVDRGTLWAEFKIARPEAPEFSVRYSKGTRDGRKDSTIWGDSDDSGQVYRQLNGGLQGANNSATVRKFTPSFLDLDEETELLEGSVKHTIGKTFAQLTLFGEQSSKNNFRYVTRFPGERLGVLPGATVITAPIAFVSPGSQWQSFNNQVIQSTFDIQDTKSKGAVLKTSTELTAKLTLNAEAKYQYVRATFSGDRMTITNAPITTDLNRALTAYPVRNLTGKSEVEVWTGRVSLDYKATENFTGSLSLRHEDENAKGRSGFDVVAVSTATVPVYTTTSRLQNSIADEKSLTPVLDLRYTGIKDLALYLSASNKNGEGNEDQTPAFNPATTSFVGVIYRDITEDNVDFTLGANWRPMSVFSVRGEVFVKDHSFQATGWNSNTNAPTAPTLNNNYDLDSQFQGGKLTVVVKPLATVSVTTRYLYQKGERQMTGYLPLYPKYDSMESKMHNLGVTVDWNPNKQFYLQANADMVFDVMGTVSLHDLSMSASGVIPANRIVQNTDNNYTTASLVAGTTFSKNDDLQFQFTYYKADNYDPLLALYGMPYGAGAKEMSVSVGLKHKFTDRLLMNAKVGYIDNKNDTTGGRTNFHGPIAYLAFEHAL